MIAAHSTYGLICLGLMWTLALVAMVIHLAWMSAPECVVGGAFIGLGLVAGLAIPAVWMRSGVTAAVLLLTGGLLYVAGTLSYHLPVRCHSDLHRVTCTQNSCNAKLRQLARGESAAGRHFIEYCCRYRGFVVCRLPCWPHPRRVNYLPGHAGPLGIAVTAMDAMSSVSPPIGPGWEPSAARGDRVLVVDPETDREVALRALAIASRADGGDRAEQIMQLAQTGIQLADQPSG